MLSLFSAGCGGLEYSPNQSFNGDSPKDINERNLKRLMENGGDRRIRFVLTGDSQRAYDEAKALVAAVNKIPEVDFVVLAGDISDFGLSQELEWVSQIFAKLDAPYIGVIGNHDLVANGEAGFKRMFGALNYSFVYQGVKFVCHNTNSREYKFAGNVPDIGWLQEQFKPEAGVEAWVAIAHVPPGGGDFDEKLYKPYITTVNGSPNTLCALYAHNHSSSVFYPGTQTHIPYIVTDAMEHRKFKLIEIFDGKVKYEEIVY